MPEYLRSLTIILILSAAFFIFAKGPASEIIGRSNFTTRRNLWFGLTIAAFLLHNFWMYTFIAIPVLLFVSRRENNTPALFFFILFVLPVAFIQIPGMGLINYLINISHTRILALFILLPALFVLIRSGNIPYFGQTGPDKLLAAYFFLISILHLRDASITEALRQAFYLFIDVFLPYFVISRSLRNLQAFRDALLSLELAIMLIALFAVFEAYKHWLLYYPLLGVLNLKGGVTNYLERDNALRAIASAGDPIALGYLMCVGIGFYLFLQRFFKQKLIRLLGTVLLFGGLIAPLSRGPWVGTSVLLVAFIATGRNPAIRMMSLVLAGVLALPLIAMLPGGEKLINMLPFIGTTEQSTISYRAQLITNSMIVIKRNPWFGSVNFLEEPEMQPLYANGIIDVVNTYIGLALGSGFVGLGLFVGFFALVVIGVYRAMRRLPDKDGEEYLLGRALLAILLAILTIIFTVSSITIIPIVYWSVAGLAVAYVQMIRKQTIRNEYVGQKQGY